MDNNDTFLELLVKQAWLNKNKDSKRLYWMQFFRLKDIASMDKKDRYGPELEKMCDWLLKNRTLRTDEIQCFKPSAFCWSTGERLFLRRAVRVTTAINGPGPSVTEYFYFKPEEYSLWLLQNN